MKHARKRAVQAGRCVIDDPMAADTLEALGIDALGLDPIDRRCVEVLRAAGAPMPLHRLAQHVGIDGEALRRRHEPHLIRLGLLAVTPRGREAIAA